MIRGYRLSVGRLRSPAAVQQGEWRVKSLGGRAALVRLLRDADLRRGGAVARIRVGGHAHVDEVVGLLPQGLAIAEVELELAVG